MDLYGKDYERLLNLEIQLILKLFNFKYIKLTKTCVTACAYFTNGNKSSQYWLFNLSYYQDKTKELCEKGLRLLMEIAHNALNNKYNNESKEILTYTMATIYGITEMKVEHNILNRIECYTLFLDVLKNSNDKCNHVGYETSLFVLDV